MPRGRAVARTALAVLALALPGRTARAQTESVARAVSPDSLGVRQRARDAVRDFERTREANAPAASGGGYCDVRIGSYCVRYPVPGDEPPGEPPGTDRARTRLVDVLSDAARALPGDDWLAGQLVRYLVEQGRLGAATAAARDCRAARWWCAALLGFALHSQEDDDAADSAFSEALAAMTPERRCAWTDLAPVLGDDAGKYGDVPCRAREGANLRLWWLARPLYSRQGNDLRAEHYARHVMARILAGTAAGQAVEAPADLAEVTVRYGWPVYWVRATGRPGAETSGLIGGRRTPTWSFFPSSGIPPAWHLDRERPATLYAPTWATRFVTIPDAQIARFRRGDTVVTVAGFDVSTDTVLAGRMPRVRLAIGTDAASPVVVGPAIVAAHGGVAVRSPDPPAVVSLEAVDEASGWVGRLRTATADPLAWVTGRLSDLLLVSADAVAAGATAPLTTMALPAATLPAGRPIGLYWEWYEHPPKGSGVTIEARVARVGGKGAPSPLGRSECIRPEKAAIAVQWREAPAARPVVARSVTLDLARLEPGRYLIAVSMQAGQGPARCTSREVLLVGG
ncbi:MAG: hypothetical protein ACM3NS_03595 [Deltaproteobacteria bacterium]